jgi:hypothetical protein
LTGQPSAAQSKVIEKIEPIALPGTQLLTMEGDIASNLVAGVDRFLLRKTDESEERRSRFWNRDFASVEKYHQSIETNRQRLAHIVGVRDARPSKPELAFLEEIVGPWANTISVSANSSQQIPTLLASTAFAGGHGRRQWRRPIAPERDCLCRFCGWPNESRAAAPLWIGGTGSN